MDILGPDPDEYQETETESAALVPLDTSNLPTNWTSAQVDRYVNHLNRLQRAQATKIMASKIPMTCKGEQCAFKKRCQLFADGVAPLGKACPIEGTVLSQTFAGFCESLDIEATDLVDVNLVRELSEIEVELFRISQVLAEEGPLMNKCVGLVDGQPVFQEDEHVLFRTQDRLRKRKERIMQLLNSTRKDKAANKLDISINTPMGMLEQILKTQNQGMGRNTFLDIDPSGYS